MPAIQSVAVDDRESTPVTHTFTPNGETNGVWRLVAGTGVPYSDEELTVSLRQTTTGKYRGRMVLKIPTVVTETINGVDSPSKIREAIVSLDVTFDEKSTEQERDNAIGLIASALDPAITLVNDTFVKLEHVF